MANSIMTNASAMTALKTLNMTNKNLEQTQSRISTGLRVSTASDNAAYWSIATTMRSDNKALSTVNDALGLGKATVDVAYTALTSSKDVLDAIKTKLVAAKQPNIDKSKIQTEISQLQKQLTGIADAASFSGANWLSIDSSAAGYEANQQVVSSFSRDSTGNLSVGTINVNLSKTALFDAGASAGLLEAGEGNSSKGGLNAITASAGSAAKAAVYTATNAFSFTKTGVIDGDDLNFAFSIDGNTVNTVVDITTASTFGIDELVAGLNGSGGFSAVATATKDVNNKLVITSKSTGATSDVSVTSVTITGNNNGTARGSASINVGTGTTAPREAAAGGTATSANFASMTFDDDDTMTFMVAVDGGTAKKLTINKALIDTSLGTTDGVIGTKANFATVIEDALAAASVTGVTVAADSGAGVKFTSSTTGINSKVAISSVTASNGSGAAFNLVDIDITNATSLELDEYINGIDDMAENVTTAAADLGAVKSRISMQTDFVKSLMDAIDRGVGQLVDADMNEESTRLQALQTQQQLGVQALSIANSSSQSLLSLFRG